MKTPRLLTSIALGVAACLTLSSCGSSASRPDASASGAGGAADDVSVLLDWAPNPDHAALYAAQQIGAYQDAGIQVSFTTPSNTADAAREVSLGRVDLAISYEPDTLIAVESGLDVVSVAALIPTSLTSLVTKAGSGIAGASDLAGKTIGLSGLASQEPTIDFIARKAGVNPDSIELPNVQQSLNQALLTDQVDAIFGAFRNIEGVELAAQTDVVVLPATELGVPDYSELVIIANPKRLETDADYVERVKAFLAGTAAGQAAAVADSHVAIDALTPQTEGSYEPQVLAAMVEATLALLPAEDFGKQSAADWATYASWMFDNGLLEGQVDGAQATTNDYLP
ncbi:ABC transporter substrate-binding protein [Brooklawnia sp.]|uniref:ABC transporter substrate-binding protein n=1 Tax=Brooklawnia sp. TaxID=2699740 RepID=UPI00311D85CC